MVNEDGWTDETINKGGWTNETINENGWTDETINKDGWIDNETKRGFGGNAPNKLRPVLKARGVSLRATHAIGTAKSL